MIERKQQEILCLSADIHDILQEYKHHIDYSIYDFIEEVDNTSVISEQFDDDDDKYILQSDTTYKDVVNHVNITNNNISAYVEALHDIQEHFIKRINKLNNDIAYLRQTVN